MSQHITIQIDGQTWYDADVDSVEIRKDDNGVQVSGKIKGQTTPGGGFGSFAERLAGRSQQKTQDMVDEKRAELKKKTDTE